MYTANEADTQVPESRHKKVQLEASKFDAISHIEFSPLETFHEIKTKSSAPKATLEKKLSKMSNRGTLW